MLKYTIKRLLLLVVTLFGITVLTFVLTRLTPGDPAALKLQRGSGSMAQSMGGYEELVELNRRNLGLNKPLALNFEFEDREQAARNAINDLFREADCWRKSGARQLQRQSTIALGPALERYPLIGTAEEPVPKRRGKPIPLVSPEKRKERLAELLPRLAAEPGLDAPTEPDDAYEFWAEWYQAHKDRYAESRVEELVRDYLSQKDEAQVEGLREEVYKAGGFAVPYLIDKLNARDIELLSRVDQSLSRQTGFSFVSRREELAERAGEVTDRWESWWRRENMSFQEQTLPSNTINIFRNTQFGLWVTQAATFDFGDSYAKKRPVIAMIGEALPVSLVISGLSILISYLIAIPIGIFSAVKRHTKTDKGVTVILFVLYSLPNFWVAGLLLLTTTGEPFLSIFPTRGLYSEGMHFGAPGVHFFQSLGNYLWHLVLPVTCLTYGSLAFISRQMRSAMLETINQDFIRTAHAKGLSSSTVIFKHALKNSLIPILTISAGLLPELIAGAVIIESIFTIPGMGTMTFEAIVNRDYPVVNAVLFFSAFLTLLGILLADISYALVDPRISYE